MIINPSIEDTYIASFTPYKELNMPTCKKPIVAKPIHKFKNPNIEPLYSVGAYKATRIVCIALNKPDPIPEMNKIK